MKFLALDPGKADFAWCAVSNSKIVGIGMFPKPIDDIREKFVNVKVMEFRRSLKKLISSTFQEELDLIVLERFQQRPGKGGGANAEFINVMIGVILAECSRKGFKALPVQASTWKNHMAHRYDPLEAENIKKKNSKPSKRKGKPKRVKRTHAERLGFKVTKSSKTVPIRDHEFDAAGIAQWHVEMKTGTSHLESFKKQIAKIWEKRSIKIAKEKEAKLQERASKKKSRK